MRILALLLLLILPLQMRAEAVRTDHLSSQLISQSRTAVPGGLLMLGLRLQHDDGWHTYWRNPGDSGLPTRISLSLPAGAQAGEILWPLPQRVPLDAHLVNFGYKGTVVLPLLVQLPADLPAGQLNIEARASWLVCREACIPGSASYQLGLPVATVAQADSRWQEEFALAARRQPRQMPAGSQYQLDGEQIILRMPRSLFPGNPSAWTFFPQTTEVVRNSQLPQWRRQGSDWVAVIDRNEYFTRPPAQFDWLMVRGDEGVLVPARLLDSTQHNKE